ncbi:hypothetical protein KIN20_003427 [Parelaphostrongylus tenuis]|uniref:Uncharacterized protein n=1 Tax=Parelaphostrongylus tenuis TaxID=148309 RepID=A0AAD5MI92_PARTN|nr:hypothetical protein KIN20_003427 [Parelaphostrongylus tenuis]
MNASHIRVFDVLESQGRSSFLPDALITAILDQVTVNITYEPLFCQDVVLDPAMDMGNEHSTGFVKPYTVEWLFLIQVHADKTAQRCIIVSNTVTGIWSTTVKKDSLCISGGQDVTIMSVPSNHTSIPGTLRTQRNTYICNEKSDITFHLQDIVVIDFHKVHIEASKKAFVTSKSQDIMPQQHK